jgi:hypothetical protein
LDVDVCDAYRYEITLKVIGYSYRSYRHLVDIIVTEVNIIMTLSVTQQQRITWSLSEISEVTGLSINFLRYEVKRGNLEVRKFGRRILVRDQDFKAYIDNGSTGGKRTN